MTLREDVRVTKAMTFITYKRMAELLGITPNSFYRWLRGENNLS